MTVVVGWVPRAEGWAALDAAVGEVLRTGERLVVVGIPRPGAAGRAGGESALGAARERLAAAGVPLEVRGGERGLAPGNEILDTVVATRARLLVIGMRRRQVLGRLITGTTAQQLLLEAPCDVLTVRAGTG